MTLGHHLPACMSPLSPCSKIRRRLDIHLIPAWCRHIPFAVRSVSQSQTCHLKSSMQKIQTKICGITIIRSASRREAIWTWRIFCNGGQKWIVMANDQRQFESRSQAILFFGFAGSQCLWSSGNITSVLLNLDLKLKQNNVCTATVELA